LQACQNKAKQNHTARIKSFHARLVAGGSLGWLERAMLPAWLWESGQGYAAGGSEGPDWGPEGSGTS